MKTNAQSLSPRSLAVAGLLTVALLGSGFLIGHANASGGTAVAIPAGVDLANAGQSGTPDNNGSQPDSETGKDNSPVAKEPATPLELTLQLDRLEQTVSELKTQLATSTTDTARLRADHDALALLVAGLVNKTGQLDDSGHYTGTIDPSQFARRLGVGDIDGSWPLDRTYGTMSANRITLSSCGDSWDRAGVAGPGYNGTLTCKYTTRL